MKRRVYYTWGIKKLYKYDNAIHQTQYEVSQQGLKSVEEHSH